MLYFDYRFIVWWPIFPQPVGPMAQVPATNPNKNVSAFIIVAS